MLKKRTNNDEEKQGVTNIKVGRKRRKLLNPSEGTRKYIRKRRKKSKKKEEKETLSKRADGVLI